jgi:hypothetical protein
LIGIEHDLHIIAHRGAQLAHQLHVEIHAARAVAGSIPEEPLLVDEAIFRKRSGALGRQRWIDGEAEAATVDAHRHLCRPA